MKKIFIDLGGHHGESIDRFYQQVSDASNYIIYSFEAHPDSYRVLVKNMEKYGNVKCINKAASDREGVFNLFSSQLGERMGSTILKGKTSYKVDYKHPIKINFINFSKWMEDNDIRDEDFIVLKMNIEGAEYDLIEFMIKNDSIKKANVLFISFHSHKFEDSIKKDLLKRETTILQYIKNNNIPLYYGKDDRKKYGLINSLRDRGSA